MAIFKKNLDTVRRSSGVTGKFKLQERSCWCPPTPSPFPRVCVPYVCLCGVAVLPCLSVIFARVFPYECAHRFLLYKKEKQSL